MFRSSDTNVFDLNYDFFVISITASPDIYDRFSFQNNLNQLSKAKPQVKGCNQRTVPLINYKANTLDMDSNE